MHWARRVTTAGFQTHGLRNSQADVRQTTPRQIGAGAQLQGCVERRPVGQGRQAVEDAAQEGPPTWPAQKLTAEEVVRALTCRLLQDFCMSCAAVVALGQGSYLCARRTLVGRTAAGNASCATAGHGDASIRVRSIIQPFELPFPTFSVVWWFRIRNRLRASVVLQRLILARPGVIQRSLSSLG